MQQTTRQRRGRPWQWLQVLTYGRACSRSAESKPVWHCSRLLAALTLMLVMLAGGSSPAWADTFWDKTNTDKGGGTYRFKGESYSILFNSAGAYANFETVKRFDIGNDQFYFDFAMRVYFFSNASQEAFVENFAFDGEIYVVTADDVSHKIATWTKKRAEATTISYSTTDDRWGTITTSQIHGYENLSVFYAPSGRAFEDGVKRIIMKQLIAVTYPGYYATEAKIQYEKDLDLSGIATDKPMPKPTVEWGTDGKLAFKATGVPDKRNNSKIGSQGYVVDLYYYENGQKSDKGNGYTTGMNNMTYSNVRDGKMDVSFSHWPLTQQTQYANAAYTVPVYVDYYAYMRLNKDGNIVPDRHVIAQPMVEGVLVKPFTRPVTVSTDFNKWNKKTLVKWTRQTSAKGFNGREVVSVDCRYEGKWHVLRYEKQKGVGTYKEIGTVDGNQTKLELTDTDFDYDREYTYRVVFLPTILETAYGTKMHQLPGYAGSHTDYDLWEEATVSTALGVHITLTQDRDYTEKVRLKWQYSIAAKGLTWYIEYKPTGGTTWRERTETIPVDVNQTEATADFSGSVCEAVTYRIKTRISGQDVYSDTLSTRLSSGSYIKNVTATTGTEQSVVKVEWDVENADPTNKIKYLVKRRPVGTEEWTTVSDSISDTKEHYEWTDTRPQTGTYYEYTVEAYGAVCPEQVEQAKMDGLVTPGFSQARGTITGHISFGSGTAVQGARVNLIKSTADQESDQVQYLSRYIEGAGKGLQWTADPTKYAAVFTGQKTATLQLWAKPASDGGDQMALATLNGALQVGVKRVGSASDYVAQMPDDNCMLISSAADWKTFINRVNNGTTGLCAIMTADVDASSVNVMAGNSSEHAYSGTFDGNGHTLTVSYNTTEQYTAPFLCAAGATIKNLRVEGTLTSSAKFVGGIVASCASGTNTITNCRVSATIDSSVNGDATNGGFVAVNGGSSTLNISDCLFDGKFTGSKATSVGGFVGWSSTKVNIQNSLVAPENVTTKTDASATFARMSNYDNLTLTNAYYTKEIGTFVQGTSTEGMDNSTLLAKLGANWQIANSQVLVKMNSVASPSQPRKTYTVTSVTKREKPAGTADTDYCLYAVDLSGGDAAQYRVTEFPSLTFGEHDFTHIAAVYDGAGKWKFYVGTDSLLTDSITVANANWKAIAAEGTTTLAIGGSDQAVNTLYKGHVDDIRLWTRALDKDELSSSYTRILGGTEDGLALYWPLDEGELVRQYAFDIACQGGLYQLNHPEVGPNATPRKEVPSLLKLYGVTDKEGDYIIKGIPFQQGGTNYKVAPELGVHSFSPATRSMYVSPTSLTANNIDFEDVSSFPMEGYVYYAGTNIPAEGVMIKVDGQPQSVDGELVKTGADGHYQLSVPIGDHYVEAYLDNHTMVDGGRYPLKNKATFIEPVRYDFYDATTVNLIGRIAGGERSDTLGVGFGNNERIVGGPSKNNIGTATITLKLNNDSRSFNRVEGKPTESATTRRVWESDTTSVRSYSWTGVNHTDSVYKDNYIYIKTDPETGEFSAKIPPLKYTVKSIVVESNKENIEFTELPELDMTVAGGSHTDSVRVLKEGSQDTTWVKYKYHTKLVRTYYAQPQLSIVENGHAPGFFGLEKITYKAQAEGEEDVTIDGLYTEKEGKPEYLVGYPIYQTGNQVKYHLRGFEVYENLDDTKNVKCDTINLPHAMITVANEMSAEQKIVYKVMDESTGYKAGQVYELQTKQMPLDDNGEADLTWTAGLPNITDPYTRKFSIALERKNRTYNVANLDAVVLGELTNGSNFVTQGPDVVDFVLRDPQGAKSTTKLTVGKTTTKTTYDTRRAYGEYKAVFSSHLGTKNEFGTGVGLIVMSDLSAIAEVDAGVHTTWEKTWNQDSTHVETTMENVVTSSSKPYVGAQGDVYIGKSHNWLVGGCRRLFIDWSEEKKKYELKLEEALAFGDTITTAFKFTQYELENVMIPKWKDMRRSFLTEVATEAEARSYVNNGTGLVYLTWKGLNEDNYEHDKNYVCVEPESWKTKLPLKLPEDSVNWCSNQIRLWEQTIRDNEADKVRLMEQGKKQNISIDGGSSYSYSKRTSNTKHDETTINWKMGAILGGGFSFANQTFINIGHNISLTTENGGGYTKGDGTITENYSEWDYTIVDGNRDTDLSLTIYESDNPKYSDFFSVFGGQTYNPYQEQEWTHYYKDDDGNYVALGNSTVQMEQPDLRIGLPGENSAKSVTVTDIPAGGEANVTLYCTNLANAHQGVNFSYDILVLDETNKNGLQILMDGVPVNGRSVYLEHSETTTKVLTIRQTDQSVMDFEGIKFWLASQYQPAKIHDEVTLNAHFSPSSSPVVLAIQEPVLNSNTPGGELEMRVKDFNRQFTNLKNVGVQYRFAGNTQWTDLYTWWVNPEDTVRLDTLKNTLLPTSGSLYYKLNMLNDLSYPEGSYEFRAFTTTPYGNELVHVYSDVVNVIKDRTRPTNLFTPAPANGILGYGDQLAIEFNEDIVPGYVGADNVIVTARLNQDKVAHDVALSLMPYGDTPRTVNPVFLNGDFSLEFWMKWEEGGTILHHGAKTDNFALAIGDDGYVTATIAKTQFRSRQSLPKNQWTFVALTYKSSEKTFNGKAVYGEENALLFSDEKVPNEALQAVTAVSDNYLYLGDVRADMHSLALYNIHRDMNLAIAEKDVVKDNYVYGLANYWPMDEGHGYVAADKRHTHDFTVPDRWVLANVNYALRIDQPEGVAVDITQATTGRGDSYAVELWYYRNGVTDEAVFETTSDDTTGDSQKDYNKLKLYYNADKDLVLQYGEKQQTVASHEDFDLNSTWHHYALNVVRGQSASFYVDGQRTAVIAEADVPPLEGTRLVMGQKATLAWVDELRIWHASLSEKRIQQNIYNALDTADIYCRGLVAYYPLEKQGKENGVDTKVFAAENLAPAAPLHKNDKGEMVSDSLIVVGVEQPDWNMIGSTFSPALKNAPNEKLLTVTPIASERKVVLNLTGATVTARQLEGTTLNITVDKVRDLHGNTSLPIRWTAYVQQNTLKWMKDSVNVFKKYGDDYTFDVEIENQSGNTELYTLYNMPQWLSIVDSERTDELAPLSTKVLRFQVNPLVPVGNYDVTIGLQGNNQILEPLRLVMKVSGERPDWTVDPTEYLHQMTIVGQVYLNGILMENEESMVAAFIGGECRGVAQPKQVRGAAYVTMNIYGTDDAQHDRDKEVTFRIWDATRGVAYTNAHLSVDGSSVNVNFSQDKMLGNYNQPAIWTKSDDVEQQIPLHQNWNWIAFGVEPESPYLDRVFSDLADWQMLVKSHTAVNDYNGAEWGYGTLTTPKVNEMYKLRVTRLPSTPADASVPSVMTVSGRQPVAAADPADAAKLAVTLAQGWNWIAYTPLTTMTIDEALAAASPQPGDIVKSQTAVAIYDQNGWEGTLTALEGGRGYMYYSVDGATKSFLYPTGATAQARSMSLRAARRAPDAPSIFTPVSPTLYPNNMTMAIRLMDGDAVVDTCEVAAFVDGECRGATRASQNGIYYLVIAGEGAGQPMTLRTCLGGEIVDIDNTQQFMSDGNVGTTWEPYVINLDNLSNGIRAIGIDEADDGDWYTLQGFKIGRKPTQPGVYIHKGNKITIRKQAK